MAGLASLTANYTDSEDEGLDDEKSEDEVTKDSPPEFGGVSGPPSIADRFRDTNESRENTPLSIRFEFALYNDSLMTLNVNLIIIE